MVARSYFLLFTLIILSLNPSEVFPAPTTLAKTADLAFGSFVGGGGASGTVTMSYSGARSYTGGVVLLNSVFSAAGFTITGNGGRSYSLTIPASFTMASGADQLTISNITCSIPLSGVLPANGILTFTIGGTVSVGTSQRSTTYSGSFSVTAK